MRRLERFSSFWIYPLAAAALLGWAETLEPDRSAASYLAAIGIGAFLWTFIEYVLHRVFFHWPSTDSTLASALSRFHRAHHAQPREPRWILARPRTSLSLSAILFALGYALAGSVALASGVMVGTWIGFLYYEWVHYRVHTSTSTLGLERQRSRHFRHHFVDEKRGFGVTSPIWDVVFGTRVKAIR